MIPQNKRKNFEEAFNPGVGSCVGDCACGRVFYNSSNEWSWGEGELESLKNNPKSTAIDYSVSFVAFEGSTYVVDCECWHPRARRLMHFIDGHAQQIAKYLTLEKHRKTVEADNSPVVGG